MIVGGALLLDRVAQIAEHWDRMGQLYASLKTGHVTASVALKRLVGFSAKNRFYRANRISAHLQDRVHPPVPLGAGAAPRIRRGLLKSSNSTPLARDVFYGRRGGSTPA